MGVKEDHDELRRLFKGLNGISRKQLLEKRADYLLRMTYGDKYAYSPVLYAEAVKQIDARLALTYTQWGNALSIVAVTVSIAAFIVSLF